jgi:spore coat protein CotH
MVEDEVMKQLIGSASREIALKIIAGVLCLFTFLMPVASTFANVVISEIMYHPPQRLDDQYEFLELYNTVSSEVNLQNWIIDGIGFTFPAGASIGPNAYLVLAADSNAFQATYGFEPNYVYTGKLRNYGEALKVLDANSTVLDEVDYATYPPWPVTPDELGPSLERIDPTQNGNTPRNWRASIAPAKHTAGALNSVNAAGLPPWISDVQHGMAEPNTPITVTALVEDATTVDLTYIINFTTPVIISMLDDGLNGDGTAGDGVYGVTIPAQPVNTLIRYRIDAIGATGAMGFPRSDDTVNYTGTLIEDTPPLTGVPVFQWFIDSDDYNSALATALTDKRYPALFYYNGTLYDGVQIHVRGGTARYWYKKQWKFFFPRNHYFFAPELIEIPVDQFNLHGCFTDKSYTREYLSYHLLADIGSPYSQYFPVRLYKNGQFFGLYFLFEDIDDDYLTRNGLDTENGTLYETEYASVSDCSYHSLAELPNYYEKHRPDDGDFNDLHDLLYGINNLTGQDRTNFIFDNVDIPRMMNYMAANIIMHDNDAVAKNYYLYRDTAGTQRWYILPWDKDLTWGRNYNGAVLNDEIWAQVDSIPARTNVSPSHPFFGNQTHQKYDYLWNKLIDRLLGEESIRGMFVRRLRTLMDEQLQSPGTPYEQRKLEKRVDELVALLDTEAEMDFNKWGTWGQTQTMSQAAQILRDSYLTVRRTHLFITHCVDVNVNSEIPSAQTSQPTIVINEIMYNPVGGDSDEFIELYNPSETESVDMSGWQLEGVALNFPYGTVLLPQSYLIVAKNDVQFRQTYGSGFFVAAQYEGVLDDGGENLVLKDRQGDIVDEVRYDDDAPWTTVPDGNGQSLELIDASQNNNQAMNWAASASTGGTPNAVNSRAGTSPFAPDLKVNEVLPVNGSINIDEQGEYESWIEIYNISPNSIDLGGMYLTDDHNNPTKWEIPTSTVLDSGQWIIFWADSEPNDGPMHTNFSLSSIGGFVGLYTAAGGSISYISYGPLPTDISYGRYPDGDASLREFVTPTPAAQNYVVPAALILNEYSAVADNEYLKDHGSDTYWGRVLGNGGDWFELVVTQDNLDIRGWVIDVNDDDAEITLTFTGNSLLSDLRSGTIITVSEDLPDDINNYDPSNGKWWINLQANADANGTFITAASFDISQKNSQITIKDSNGTVIFGPAGEGINPVSGIGNDEIFKLEENPGPDITERSHYNDGSSSTFGAPNIYAGGTKVQDFNELRNAPDTVAPTPNPLTWANVPTATGSTSITMKATTASDTSGVEYYFESINGGGNSSGWQDSPYYKDKGLAPNTVYNYRVKARDKSPAQNETAWSDPATEVTLLAPITLILDNFETDFGNWTTDGGSCTWIRYKGDAPPTNTGPNHDNTIGVTGWYIYVDTASGVCQGSDIEAIITSPLLDADYYSLELSFYYHMYGAESDMGILHVDVNNGSAWVNDVATITGQHLRSLAIFRSSVYTMRKVSLDSFTGTIRIRLRYDGVKGVLANAALDDITVKGTPRTVLRALTVSSTDGGSVTNPGEGAFPYDQGEIVNLNASPDFSYRFVNWTGDTGTIGNTTSANTTITMNENYDIQANFEWIDVTLKIDGYIKNECNAPISGVVVSANNIGSQDITDANGFYEVWVVDSWSGTVTPEKENYTFIPAESNYVDVLENQTGQNYTAYNICDIDCNGFIDFVDLAEIIDNWLLPGPEGNFNADETVNFLDFAVFAACW